MALTIAWAMYHIKSTLANIVGYLSDMDDKRQWNMWECEAEVWLLLNAELAPVPFLFQQLLLSVGALQQAELDF